MPSISDIVQVSVSTQTAQIKQAGFGIPLIVGYHTKFPERIRYYTDMAGVDADFNPEDPEYKAASDLFAQNPQVTKLGIGRRVGAPDMQVDITPTAQNSKLYSVKVTGPTGASGTASFTSDASATVAEITAGLTSAITALALPNVVATDQTTHVRVKADAVGKFIAVEALDLQVLSAKQTHALPSPSLQTDLGNIQLENNEWYCVSLTTASSAEILDAAVWVEANKKLMIQRSQDGDILAAPTTDVASSLKNSLYFRTALIFHPDGNHFAGAAWAGATMALDPGSLTFAFRQLGGISKTPLTGTQVTNLKAKNCNFFADYGGVGMTQEGKVAAGEWIDIIRDRDWYESRLKVLVLGVLVNNLKVPFTDPGIGLIEAQVRKATREAILAGFLAEGTDVYIVPKAADVASIDRAARRLATIKVSARVAGAIHVVKIDATITA